MDKDQDEVDIVIENEAAELVGIEVKAAATVNASDFKELRKLVETTRDALKLGLVLYDGEQTVPFGDRLFEHRCRAYGLNAAAAHYS